MSIYTPGPWTITRTEDIYNGIYSWLIEDVEEGEAVAVLNFASEKLRDTVGAANANLIAATPEMYDELKSVLHSIENEGVAHGRVADNVRNITAIITRIEGE